ncbi:hypothetical protein LY28_00599 [Ruminiclostridium sufflavum DSM 19573]|uniref:Uncharacterized protein n=1 Tax=Ruminiclostridium sufflavum DSM 19573 TaxID=1121337 RepID=A0A318XPZ2_9FIRM|nr:hypothetical protein [Ruminiclostridium sufflavum]PYG89380.1 hypothetical protein LY28_00599 [Ruminiclostridium sufflavum DSM 19573]
MSKYFMYGTELQEIEQLMMLVPNFMPRGSGVIVVKETNDKKGNLQCPCGENICNYFTERLAAGMICYETIVDNCFKEFKAYRFKRRLARLARNFDGEVFINLNHRFRFCKVCRIQNISIENRNPAYLAVLFLLTADDRLWDSAKGHIYLDCFDFKRMNLNLIDTDGYALYQTARTILFGKEYISMSEIADEALIRADIFKAIINAILISKFGADMFQVNC